jgi:hypothetical protein
VAAQADLRHRGEPAKAIALRPGLEKAVSDRFISCASACIQPVQAGPASKQTAAGLPPNTVPVKASTWKSRMAEG